MKPNLTTFLAFFLLTLMLTHSLESKAQTIPFGSNNSYTYGTMQTYHTGTQADAVTQSWYDYWKTNFIRSCGGGKSLAINDYSSQNAYSEGQGYGLLLAAYMGDKTLFDELWKGYKDNRNGNGVMHWTVNCSGTVASNGATDGDLDAAMGLLIANKQWPNTTSPYNYSTEATTLITDIKDHEFTTCNGKTVQKPGDMFGGCDCTNPSYFAVGYYRAFAQHIPGQATFWEKAAVDGTALLLTATNSSTGLNPAWTDQTGSITSGGNCNVAASGGGTKTDYQFDAARTPWRIIVDYLWWGSAPSKQYLDKISAWANTKGVSNIKAGMKTDGSDNVSYRNSSFTGAFAIGTMATGNQTTINAFYNWWVNNSVTSGDVGSKLDDRPYFQNSLRVMYSLVASGNFWNPYATTTNPSSITVSLTTPANNANFAEGSNITLSASASTTNGSISKVEFYAGATKLGEDLSSPYSFTWNNVTAGTYSITAVATSSASETKTSSVVTINVNKAIFQTASAPTIDGTVDAVWSSISPTTLGNTNQPTISSPADLTASWRAMWDATNLYILVEVTDDVKRNDAGTDTYNDDELEVYFDFGNNKPTTYGADDHQYTFRWNDATLVRETNSHATTGIVRSTANPSGTTYVTEVRIPWSTIGGTPAIDQLHGFDVMVNDDDDGGARDGKKAWSATGDDTWDNPSLMGTVILKASTCTPPAAAGTISGTSPICASSTGNIYTIATATGATSYNWTVPTGATITNGTGTASITVTFGTTSGNITVTPVNACGSGTASSKTITLNSLPAAAGTISGNSPVCRNSTGNMYTIASVTGATSYNWTVPSGATITNGTGTASITVTFGTTSGNITVTPVNACGNGTTSSKTITVNSVPAAAGTISGTSPVCRNSAGNIYTIASVTGATSYNWTVPSGATITNGTGTASITVTFGTTSGNITVTPVNACGNGTTSSKTITVNSVPAAAGTISGTSPVCRNSTGNIYTIASVTGATSYNWTVPTGASITNGTGTASITVTFGTTSGNITVTPVNACGNGTASSKTITVNSVPAAAGTISGTSPVCRNSTGNVYSIATVTGATSYNWTVPTGATITNGTGTASITVTFGTTSGNITVTPVNACGNGTASSKTITLNTLPSSAGTISGTSPVCASSTGNAYSIPTVTGATSYNWTLPTGSTITDGTGTSSITVTFGTTSGNLTVTPVNSCGNGGSRSLSVSIDSPPTTANAGANQNISTTSITMAANSPTIGTGAWSVVTGSANFNIVNSPTTAVSGLSAGSNILKWTISNGVCTPSIDEVEFFVGTNPPTSNITGDAYVNPNETGLTYSVTNTSGSTYNWTVPAGATIVSGQGTSAIVVDFGTSGGTVSVTETNGLGTQAPVSKTVDVGNPPLTSDISGKENVNPNETGVTYSVTNNPTSTYTWTVPADATIVSGQGTSAIVVDFGISGGTISVTEGNNFGTADPKSTNIIMGTTGVTGSNAIGIVELYPNPFHDEVTLNIKSSTTDKLILKVTDIHGKTLYSIEDKGTNEDIKLGNDLDQGIYLIHAICGEKIQLIKLVKLK